MQRAWLVLLVGCGFRSPGASGGDGTPIDASIDASDPGGSPGICRNIGEGDFHVSACVATMVERINVNMDVVVDTDGVDSNALGLTCASLLPKSSNVCVLAANMITLESGRTLLAHGMKPLVLLGHSIDIQGIIDVASHIHGQLGPASNQGGCNSGRTATKSGGGGGGGFGVAGGKGGHEGGTKNTSGAQGTSVGLTGLRGGCDGGRGGDGTDNGGSAGSGGAGGGAVWIAVDTGPLTIGTGAVLNASGASGSGGTSTDHGGYGGGSGGLIVLQAPEIMMSAGAVIFANGGHGGGGAQDDSAGADGVDPIGPASGGGDGAGGASTTATAGDGGFGFPGTPIFAQDGDALKHGGGGGGGGGAGMIRVVSATAINSSNVSPPAVQLTP